MAEALGLESEQAGYRGESKGMHAHPERGELGRLKERERGAREP